MDIFSKPFSALALLFLLWLWLAGGWTVSTIPQVGLAGALLAILFWPPQRVRF